MDKLIRIEEELKDLQYKDKTKRLSEKGKELMNEYRYVVSLVKNLSLHDVMGSEAELCDHPPEEIIKTNGYRCLCLKCGRNIN